VRRLLLVTKIVNAKDMSEDRLLSGEEKRARLREKFKRDLQQDKQLREDLQRAQKTQAINRQVQALEQQLLTSTDDTLDVLGKLTVQTAWNEAKLDLALERHSPGPEHHQPVSSVPRTASDPITDALPPHLQTANPAPLASNLPRRLADGTWHNPHHEIEFPIANRLKTLGNRQL
jgi:hypothetical protein